MTTTVPTALAAGAGGGGDVVVGAAVVGGAVVGATVVGGALVDVEVVAARVDVVARDGGGDDFGLADPQAAAATAISAARIAVRTAAT